MCPQAAGLASYRLVTNTGIPPREDRHITFTMQCAEKPSSQRRGTATPITCSKILDDAFSPITRLLQCLMRYFKGTTDHVLTVPCGDSIENNHVKSGIH